MVQADFDAVQDAMRNQYATSMVGVTAETTSSQVQAELQRALGHLQELKQIVDDDISKVERALDDVIQQCESVGVGQ
jgi:hypothetical protein